MTFEQMLELDPVLKSIWEEAQHPHVGAGETFCADQHWGGTLRRSGRVGLKHLMMQRVGQDAPVEEFQNDEAYMSALYAIKEAIPPCTHADPNDCRYNFEADPKSIDRKLRGPCSLIDLLNEAAGGPEAKEIDLSLAFVVTPGAEATTMQKKEYTVEQKNKAKRSANVRSGLASDIPMTLIGWTWPERFAHKLNVLCGNPDVGKSLVAIDTVARLTTGKEWFDCPNENPISEALILAAEDDWSDTLCPRLVAAGADLTKVRWLKLSCSDTDTSDVRELALDTDMKVLRDFLADHPDIRLVVIDPISSYLGNKKMNEEQSVRSVLTPLKNLADKFDVCVVAIMHLNKKVELDAIHRIGGATAFTGVARMVWMCAPKPVEDDEPKSDELYMVRVKGNIIARSTLGLSYRTDVHDVVIQGQTKKVPFVDWIGKVDTDAADITHHVVRHDGSRGRKPVKINEAVEWIRGYLKNNGAVPLSQLQDDAKAIMGFSADTVLRARTMLGVKTEATTGTDSKGRKNRKHVVSFNELTAGLIFVPDKPGGDATTDPVEPKPTP